MRAPRVIPRQVAEGAALTANALRAPPGGKALVFHRL